MATALTLYQKLHFMHRCWRYRLRTERQQLARLFGYRLAGTTVFDVGANHGIYTYWLGKAVGANGKVHAFEPQPELQTEIKQLTDWLGWGYVHVNAMALSDSNSLKTLQRTRVGDGSATLQHQNNNFQGMQSLEIASTTLDAYCQLNSVESMSFIKIDVEGHELSVIQGGLATLKKFKPVIQVELRVHEPTCDQVIEVLSSMGYTGVMLCDGQEITTDRYKTVPSKKFGFIGHRDFVFDCTTVR